MDIKEELLQTWSQKCDFLSEKQKEAVLYLVNDFGEDVSFLYVMNAILVNGEGHVSNDEKRISFYWEEDILILQIEDVGIMLSKEKMHRLLADLILIVEPLYPLGTVVELKKEFFGYLGENNLDTNIKAVISGRFIGTQDSQLLFPYAALLYPLGMIEPPKVVHFTSPAIDRVVYMGYSDEVEVDFIWRQKGIILEQDMKSIAFASPEEINELSKQIGVEE